MKNFNDFIDFVDQSPIALFAANHLIERLKKLGFHPWDNSNKAGRYFTRRGDSVIAFCLGGGHLESMRMILSHLDSPALKVKSCAQVKSDLTLIPTESYGGPTLVSYLDCPLRLVGRAITEGKNGKHVTHLIDSKEAVGMAMNLAPHLDPERNKMGTRVDKQKDMKVVVATKADGKWLENFLKKQVGELPLASELFFVPAAKIQKVGSLLAGYRLDNMTSAYAALLAIEKLKPTKGHLSIAVFFDHEEIGSITRSGAESGFVSELIESLVPKEDRWKVIENSSALSIDVGHALTPSYIDRFDEEQPGKAGKGVLLKRDASGRYSFDLGVEALIASLGKKHKIPLQHAFNHSNLATGSTVGYHVACKSGLPMLDLGIPLFSMHSTTESCESEDFLALIDLTRVYFEDV